MKCVRLLTGGLAVAIAAVLGSGVALADGMARTAAPVAQAPTSWSGFYFGVHSGWQWSDIDSTSVTGVSLFSVSHDSPVVGGQIGIQHQFGLFVVGVEGTLTTSYQNDYGSTNCPNILFTCAARFDDVLTIGPRLGYAQRAANATLS